MMSENQVTLSVNDVMEARFRQSLRGYNQGDVDEFLEIVTNDYAALNKEIDRLKQEVDQLKKGYGYK